MYVDAAGNNNRKSSPTVETQPLLHSLPFTLALYQYWCAWMQSLWCLPPPSANTPMVLAGGGFPGHIIHTASTTRKQSKRYIPAPRTPSPIGVKNAPPRAAVNKTPGKKECHIYLTMYLQDLHIFVTLEKKRSQGRLLPSASLICGHSGRVPRLLLPTGCS